MFIASTVPTTPIPLRVPTPSYLEEKEGSSSKTEKKTIKPIKLLVKRSDDSLVNLSIYDVSFDRYIIILISFKRKY